MIKEFNLLRLIIFLNFIFYACISNAGKNLPLACEITPISIAKIKLGIRLNQIKTIYPSAKLERTSDGEGLALVSLTVGNQDLAVIYAGEDTPDDSIDLSSKVEFIETFNPVCKTKLGIHPGTTVKKAEKLLGGVDKITLSEIESRQYVDFKKQSKNYSYRIDYCGDFKNGARETKKYQLSCKIFSIAISGSFIK